MKKLLIVPILALAVSTFGSAAQAHHPGAQGPDLAPEEDHCYVEFHAHASCTVTHSDPPNGGAASTSHIAGVPTADGWHVDVSLSLIENDTNQAYGTRKVVTIPYIEDWLGVGAPLPSPPFDGNFINPRVEKSTSSTCVADVAAGNGGIFQCYIGGGGYLLPPGVPEPV